MVGPVKAYMSFYLGITLESHSILVPDRRRHVYSESPSHEDDSPKIWRIRDDLFLTAAGLLYLAEGFLLEALPQVVKDSPLDMNLLVPKLPEWAKVFDTKYKEMEHNVIAQLESKGLDPAIQKEQSTSVLLAGVDGKGVPFLLGFYSLEEFKPHLQHGTFRRSVLPLFSEDGDVKKSEQLTKWVNNAVVKRLTLLAAMTKESDRVKRAVKIMPEVVRLVAAKGRGVSPEYDLVVIGRTSCQTYSG